MTQRYNTLIAISLGAWFSIVSAGLLGAEVRSYPALGHIDFRQGTVEMWVTPNFDPHRETEETTWTRNLVNFEQDGENYFQIIWRYAHRPQWGHRAGIWVRGNIGGERSFISMHLWPSTDDVLASIQEGERFHVAYCWDAQEIWVYVNGELLGSRQPMSGGRLGVRASEDLKMVVGDSRSSNLTVEDLRISSLPRRPDELGFHEPEGMRRDVLTLFLEE
jgi:hypothetical protein